MCVCVCVWDGQNKRDRDREGARTQTVEGGVRWFLEELAPVQRGGAERWCREVVQRGGAERWCREVVQTRPAAEVHA